MATASGYPGAMETPGPSPLHLLRRQDPAPPVRPRSRRQRAGTGLGEALCCIDCGTPVTTAAEAVEMAGAHHHRCTNPAGVTFDIGCFRSAPGCMQTGPETAEHSWFPGHRWRLALCRGCGGHLGWGFHGPDRFFGLIRSRLRPGPR